MIVAAQVMVFTVFTVGFYNVLFIFFCEIQVPLLTSMGEEERALVKAIESGDTDLVYFSIFHIWRQVSTSLFVWV